MVYSESPLFSVDNYIAMDSEVQNSKATTATTAITATTSSHETGPITGKKYVKAFGVFTELFMANSFCQHVISQYRKFDKDIQLTISNKVVAIDFLDWKKELYNLIKSN